MGTFATLQNLIKPFIGVGILAMPKIWSNGGVVASSLLLILLAIVATWCIFRLVECTDVIMRCQADHNRRVRLAQEGDDLLTNASATGRAADITAADVPFFTLAPVADTSASALPPPSMTTSTSNGRAYQNAVSHQSEPSTNAAAPNADDWASITVPTFTEVGVCAFGPLGGSIVNFCIIVTQTGGCIAYLIFVSNSMSEVTGLSHIAWIGIMFPLLTLLTFVRRTDTFAPVSTLANIVYVYTIIMIFYDGLSDCCVPSADVNLVDLSYLPAVFGVCSFSLEGIALILPVKRRMLDQSTFQPIMAAAGGCVCLLYLTVAVSGYLFWGSDVASPVLGSLHAGWHADSVKVALSLSIFFTFVLMVLPASEFFDEVIDAKLGIDLQDTLKQALDSRTAARRARQSGSSSATASKGASNSKGVSASTGGVAAAVKAGSLNSDENDDGDDDSQVNARRNGPTGGRAPSHRVDNGSSGRDGSFGATSLDGDQEEEEEALTIDDVHLLIPDQHQRRRLYQNLARAGFVAFCSIIAIIFPNFQLVIMLFGSFTLSLLAYILPPIFWLRVCSTTHLYGFDFFPFARDGASLGPHPVTGGQSQDSADSAVGSAVAAVPAAATAAGGATADAAVAASARGAGAVAERGRLTGSSAGAGKAGKAVPPAVTAEVSERPLFAAAADVAPPSTWKKLGVMGLATVVAVVGILASAVGITEAVIDIKNELVG
jgi:amino acid permease